MIVRDATVSEYPTLKAAYSQWLDASNFDAQGKQIRRLADLIVQEDPSRKSN
jgi:hypothetical protein